MGKNMSTPALMGIWFVTSMIMSFMLMGTALIPGINFVGLPMGIMASGLVHVIFISMIVIRMAQKSKFTDYNRKKNMIKKKND